MTAPTETPCQRLAICILGNGHEDRCVVVGCAPADTPSLTTEQARVHDDRELEHALNSDGRPS